MVKSLSLVLTAAILLAACGRPDRKLTEADIIRIDRDVRILLDGVAEDLGRRGPIAWLDHFHYTPAFFMASDGQVVFEDIDAAVTFVESFAPTIEAMSLDWIDVRVDPLEEGMAVVGASYDESFTDTAGVVTSFSGYFTGLAVGTADGWKLRSLHWSSPVAAE
jgi:hypothetical protein